MFSYLSVCSGLEGASLAFESLGATPVGFAEIDKFPAAIIAERYGSNLPGEQLSCNAPPNFGDFTRIPVETLGRVDVLIGGTPCQAFSIAGKRLSLEDARGNLTLAYAVLAHELVRLCGLRNCIWENVPGALNTPDNAFGCFLGAIVGADDTLRTPDGGSWPDAGMVAGPRARAAWRVFDAQYFGLAQRRRRVFLVADFGNGADPAAVLFEPKSLRGNSPPRRQKGEGIAPTIAARTRGGGGLGTDFDCDGGLIASTGEISHCLNAGGMGRQDFETETLVAHALRAEGFDASEDGTGRGTPIVPVLRLHPFCETCSVCHNPNNCDGNDCWLVKNPDRAPSDAIAFSCKDHGADATEDLAPTMRAMPHDGSHPNAGGQLAVAFAIQERAVSENPNSGPDGMGVQKDVAYTLEARTQTQAVAFDLRGREGGAQFEGPHDTANIRAASGGSSRSYVAERWAVRRLTPAECESLQGVPRDYTRISWRGKPASECPDGHRYKALGNSWAIPVVAWLGKRLAENMPK